MSEFNLIRRIYHAIRVRLQRAMWLVLSPAIRCIASSKLVTLTCTRRDGGGAQIQARFSVEAFAKHFGFPYQQQAIQNLLPVTSKSTLENWNSLLGLDSSGPLLVAKAHRKARGVTTGLWHAGKAYLQQIPCIIDFEHCHNFIDLFPNTLEALVPVFRERSEKALASWEKTFGLPQEEIVVHLRRGLVDRGDETLRITPDSILLSQLAQLRKKYPKHEVRIYTYEPNPALAAKLPSKTFLDWKSSEFQVMLGCSRAKVFVMAKSSFSYVAGVLNPNTVIYQDFWHPKLSSWIKLMID